MTVFRGGCHLLLSTHRLASTALSRCSRRPVEVPGNATRPLRRDPSLSNPRTGGPPSTPSRDASPRQFCRDQVFAPLPLLPVCTAGTVARCTVCFGGGLVTVRGSTRGMAVASDPLGMVLALTCPHSRLALPRPAVNLVRSRMTWTWGMTMTRIRRAPKVGGDPVPQIRPKRSTRS